MKIKTLLMRENDTGILRQELVAMIPINLVNIEDDHIIMDMCAAPGNKSVQILEIMEEKARDKGIIPRGVLISNEFDTKRADNLAHFLKTQFPINSIVINSAAQDIPLIKDNTMKPDIVFCDVPCSGDGTLRKNKGLRKRWKFEYAYQNYPLQISILENSIKQCKKDGYVVYSTCSINPIENEAVVRAVLEKYKDSIELVNVVNEMNKMDIKFEEGLVKWKVCYDWSDINKLEWAYNYEQVKTNKHLIKQSMFDDNYTQTNYQNKIYFSDPLCLRRCIRIYSHKNNTGSFFIAVFKKISNSNESNSDYSVPLNKNKMKTIGEDLEEFMKEIGLVSEINEIQEDNKKEDKEDNIKNMFFSTQIDISNDLNTVSKSEDETKPKEDPNDQLVFTKYVPFSSFPDSLNNLQEIFSFKTNKIFDQFYCYRVTSLKIFLISEKMSHMLNILNQMNVNIIKSGMIAFKKERQTKNFKTKYRMTYYGAITLEQMIQNQTIEITNHTFIKTLFDNNAIPFNELPPDIKEKIDSMEGGTIIMIYESFVFTCRKGINNLSLFIPKAIMPSLAHYIKIQLSRAIDIVE